MKNYHILAAAALLTLAACSKNEVRPASSDPQEITFQTVVGGVKTKALVTGESYPTGATFGSYAYYHEGNFTGKGNLYIDNAEIKYDGNSTPATWHADKKYYWPKDGSKLTFYAYSPYSISAVPAGATTSPVTCSVDKGVKISDWDVKTNSTVDVLVADVAKDKTANETGTYVGVPTVFRHKLTQIAGFTVKTKEAYSDVTFTIKSISIKNAKYKGTYENEVWTAADDKTAYEWYKSTAASATSYTISNSETEVAIEPNSLPADDNNTNKYLLVLPQVFTANEQQLEIVYNIDNGTFKYDVTATKDLKDITDGSTTPTATVWEKNKKVSYTITIGLDVILWNPNVVDWDPISGTIEL